MSSPAGLTFRLVGPLIEVFCLIGLQKWGGEGRTVAGLAVEYWLYAGLALGFALVVVGLTWFRRAPVDPADPRDRS